MTGGDGSLSRGTAKSAAAAATATATGPQGPLKRYPAKMKAKKEAPGGTATAMRAPGEQKYRELSKADISWILSLKPMKPPARYAALKRSNPELTPQPGEEADEDKRRLYRLAKAFFEMEERLPATQEWVRSELNEKGYVELDRESAKRRAEVQAVIDRE